MKFFLLLLLSSCTTSHLADQNSSWTIHCNELSSCTDQAIRVCKDRHIPIIEKEECNRKFCSTDFHCKKID